MIKLRPDQLDLRLGFLRPVHAGAQEKMAASLIRHDQLTAVVACLLYTSPSPRD